MQCTVADNRVQLCARLSKELPCSLKHRVQLPCAWSWHDVSPSDQEWNAKAVAEAQRGPQHSSVRARNALESLVYGADPLQMFLRHEAAKSGA